MSTAPAAALGAGPSGFVIVPLEIIPLDRPLPYSLYVRIADQPVLFRKAGDTVTAARCQALRERNVTAVEVKEAEWAGMLSSLERSLQAASSDNGAEVVDLALASRGLAMLYWREIEHRKVLSPYLMEQLKNLASNIADAIAREPSIVPKLLRRYEEPSLYFLSHTVNVAVFSIAIGNKQKLPAKELRRLASACLLHNVGNILLPSEVLHAPRALTEEESKQIRRHAELGAELLASRGAPDDMVLTALQHHESYDGSGYPNRSSGESIHPFARICRIADTYDALLSARPHAPKPLSPLDTIKRMVEMHGQFDPRILSAANLKPGGSES